MVLLQKSYGGYAAGTIRQFSASTEDALIAGGIATASAGPVTTGAATTTENRGRAAIAAAGTNVVISNPAFTAESRFIAYLSNAAADGTALYITRIIPADGQVTFTLNAAATAAVSIDWLLLLDQGFFAVI
jgi:carbohydrate-binding DOMON domain-containing protein